MNKIKVMTVFGTRPEAIKMAPLVKELEKHSDIIDSIVCVTAQHRQMLDQVLEIFHITPDFDLNIMKQRQTLVEIVGYSLEGLDQVMKEATAIPLRHLSEVLRRFITRLQLAMSRPGFVPMISTRRSRRKSTAG